MPGRPNGNRNLAKKTSKDWSKPFTGFSGIRNTCPNLYKVITDGLVVGDTLKTRIVLKYTDIKPVSGKTAEIWIQGAGNVTAWNSGTYPSGGGGRRSLSGSGEAVFELTDKINADHLKNDYWSWAFRTDWIASGSLQWKLAKVERNTLFSDWSPAPEDLDWSATTLVPTQQQRYLWKFEYIYYSDGSVEVTKPVNLSIAGADADTTGVTEELDKTKQELTAKIEKAQNDSLAAVEEAKQELTKVNTKVDSTKAELTQAKQDLVSQAQQLQTQANAQTELTNRVTTVETTANGTKTTVSELSKTVAQNGKDITSVTARTKVVEDDLAGTKTTLSQVKMTADTTSQKTATLKTGLNGLSAKFETLKIGSRNYFKDSKSRKYYIDDRETQDVRTFIDDEFWQNDTRLTKDYVRMSFDIAFNPALPSNFTTSVNFGASPWYNCGGITFKGGTTALQHFDLKFNLSGAGDSYKTDNVFIRLNNTLPLNTAVSLENFNLYLSAVIEDYSSNEADIESKVAEYKQTADQNYASLQTTVQNLDGTVQHNKTVADQTAQGFTTRIESLETYKDGESTRANQYFELAKTETARQLSVERTAIAKDYVAKSTYTSDVTGIRNELSATTTTANTIKTNLANYQASNDKVVASLKSSLQTTDGNVSNLQTKVEAVPGQITSAVSAVEGKIPTSKNFKNLYVIANSSDGYLMYGSTNLGTASSVYRERTSDYIAVEAGEQYTFQIWATLTGNQRGWRAWQFYNEDKSLNGGRTAGNYTSDYQCVQQTLTVPTNAKWMRVSARMYSDGKIMVEKGNEYHDYMLAPEDAISGTALTQAKSEIKQTTDSIKASVSSLDKSTVKNSSLTINTDGIVMKAGKSTTDVANAIGSYFAVNQNAINLFADKINVKGSMIVSGAITSDKIAANSISSDKIVSSGITADVIKSGVLKAANDAMQINLNSSNITFSKDASVIFTSSDNALKRVIPDKPSQFIKMFDDVFVSEIGELPNSTLTVIGSNSDRTESSDSSGFGGLRIWNGSSSTDTTSFVELVGNRVAIYGNKNRSPWLFDMTTTTSSLIPQNSNGIKHSLGRGDRPFHEVHADNMYIQGERVAMMLKDIALHIGYKGNNGWVDRIG